MELTDQKIMGQIYRKMDPKYKKERTNRIKEKTENDKETVLPHINDWV